MPRSRADLSKMPSSPDGYVPEEALLNHFYRSGKVTDHAKDYDDPASHVYPIKLTPKQAAAWWTNPTRNDIEYIDAPGKAMYNTSGIKDPRSKKVHQKIGVVAPPSKEEEIRQLFDESYPIEEQEKMVKKNGLIISLRPLGKSVGRYDTKATQIELDYEGGRNNSTMVHEGAHHLRRVDDSRSSKVTKSPANGLTNMSMVNVEESCTVAEQMARGKNPSSGYYGEVMVFDKKTKRWRKPTESEAVKMMEEDRKLFTNGTNTPLTGKAAVDSVNKNWHKSHIARLKIEGSGTMAIKQMEKMDTSVKSDSAYQATLYETKRKAAKVSKGHKSKKKQSTKTSFFKRSTKTAAKKPVNKKPATRNKACRAR